MVGGLRITLIIRLCQPSLAGVGAGAELGNNESPNSFEVMLFEYPKNIGKIKLHK